MSGEIDPKELPEGLRLLTTEGVTSYIHEKDLIYKNFLEQNRITIIKMARPLAEKILAKAEKEDKELWELLFTDTVNAMGMKDLRLPLIFSVIARTLEENSAQKGRGGHIIISATKTESTASELSLAVKEKCERITKLLDPYLKIELYGVTQKDDHDVPAGHIVFWCKINTQQPFIG